MSTVADTTMNTGAASAAPRPYRRPRRLDAIVVAAVAMTGLWFGLGAPSVSPVAPVVSTGAPVGSPVVAGAQPPTVPVPVDSAPAATPQQQARTGQTDTGQTDTGQTDTGHRGAGDGAHRHGGHEATSRS